MFTFLFYYSFAEICLFVGRNYLLAIQGKEEEKLRADDIFLITFMDILFSFWIFFVLILYIVVFVFRIITLFSYWFTKSMIGLVNWLISP